jgi:CRISPR-associated protein Cas5t
VLRTIWRFKENIPQGNGRNVTPSLQQLWCNAELMIWCDSSDDLADEKLEKRVTMAMRNPEKINRFGGWSLGESTHLINDAWLLPDAAPPPERTCRVFLLDPNGSHTFPVWVDHVGMAGTVHEVGELKEVCRAPLPEEIPKISPRQL